MNIASTGHAQPPQAASAAREAAETPGVPDHDGDADDTAAAAASPPAKAALPSGVGRSVDKTA